MDEKNKDLIGKHAMHDMVRILPSSQTPRPSNVTDDTVASVLSVIYITTSQNASFARAFHEAGGVERLIFISCSNQFEQRVIKYAKLVLDALWRHRELQDVFRRAGYKETDFVLQTLSSRGAADTLARPVSTRGVERGRGAQSRVRPDWNDEFSYRAPQESPGGERHRLPITPRSAGGTPSGQVAPPLSSTSMRSGEPLYAQVQKKKSPQGQQPLISASVGHTPTEPAYDSWV